MSAEMFLRGSRFEPCGSDRARHATAAGDDAALPLRWIAEMNHILKNCLYYGASRVGELPFFRARFAARAVIILLHEIQPDCQSELMTGTSVSLFEYSLDWLQREGWSIVSLDECLEKLATNDQSRRYAVLSFDDGYRDNVSLALPILERHNAPFMMYVPTGALTRSMQTWWLGLRKLFLSRDKVAIEALGRRFLCFDLRSKRSALSEVTGGFTRTTGVVQCSRRRSSRMGFRWRN